MPVMNDQEKPTSPVENHSSKPRWPTNKKSDAGPTPAPICGLTPRDVLTVTYNALDPRARTPECLAVQPVSAPATLGRTTLRGESRTPKGHVLQQETQEGQDLGQAVVTSAERLHASLNGISELFASAEPQARKLQRARHDIKKLIEGLIDDHHVDDFMKEWAKAFGEEVAADASEEVKNFLRFEESDRNEDEDEDEEVKSNEVSTAYEVTDADNLPQGEISEEGSREITPNDLSPEATYELVELGMAALRSRKVLDFVAQHGVWTEYLARVNHRLLRPHDSFVLANSIVVMAVSNFESHIAALLHIYFSEHRGAASTGDVGEGLDVGTYTLKDLLKFQSIDELIDAAIDERIDQFMRQSFTSWADWWKQTLDGDWKLFAADWEAAIEVVQRRHVIMHNGARVSRQYLSNVPERFRGVEVGDRLTISEDYVQLAIENLLSLGLLASYNLCLKLAKDAGEDIASVMLSKSCELLVTGQYGAARRLAVAGSGLRCSEAVRMPLWINSLIARKELEGKTSISKELEKWDDSAASAVLRMAKAALLDDFDALAELLPEAIESGSPEWSEVKRWPLLRSFREQPLYVDMLERYEGDSGEREGPSVAEDDVPDGDGIA
jgi:hypothetical protein